MKMFRVPGASMGRIGNAKSLSHIDLQPVSATAQAGTRPRASKHMSFSSQDKVNSRVSIPAKKQAAEQV